MFAICGLNHKTAPLTVREKVSLSVDQQEALLNKLINIHAVNEAVILSTCNRTEIYCDTNDPQGLITWLAHENQLTAAALSPYLYLYQGYQGVRHALNVACGLDSMMLGEPQILGQMKQAYQQACRLGVINTNLRQVFEYVFSASKRIRGQTGIGTNPVSVAYTAAQIINQSFTDLKSLRVFLIGSGETANLVAKYLHQYGVAHFFIASKTLEKAQQLASSFDGEALTINEIPQYLAKTDVVISATACPVPFINKRLVEQALTQRLNAPMFFLDLAVPRDIEPEVGELESVTLYNIDDLQIIITKGLTERRSAALKAEHLIDNEMDKYARKNRSLLAKDVICDYRHYMQHLAEQELQRAQAKLSAGSEQQIVLQEFCQRLVNKLTHSTTIGLRQAAWDGREELFELVNYLYKKPIVQSYEKIS